MILGYSCWGFLGRGVVDTPDGGRSHRLTLLQHLIEGGAEIVMLQKNRDLEEAGEDFSGEGIRFERTLPPLDALFLEYRWPIHGRNTGNSDSSPKYTPDLQRQQELLAHYGGRRIPILIWDKDQKLPDAGLTGDNFLLFEPALQPRPGRRRLLFPLDPVRTAAAFASIDKYTQRERAIDLMYIGNQYERDESFAEYIDKPAGCLTTKVPIYGNWTKYDEKYSENCRFFPNVCFHPRIHYSRIHDIYSQALTTVLIAPQRYYSSGQYTQRLFESLWGGCIPLTPDCYHGVSDLIIPEFVVQSGDHVVDVLRRLRCLDDEILRGLLRTQHARLEAFSALEQAAVILSAIRSFGR